MNTIFAKKIKMTAKYDAAGHRVGATVLSVPQMKVAGLRTVEKNGYSAIQIETGTAKREVRVESEELSNFSSGAEIAWDQLIQPGDKVRVSGISKGHGFTGVVKHYNFKGGPRTHGQSDRERARGSSGATTTPGRVYRGKRMAGRMGNDRITMRNLRVLEVNVENRQIVLAGSVPGKVTGIVEITKL
jgi:large subunit ribosomal protein L3